MTDFSYILYSPSKLTNYQPLLPLHKNACGNRMRLIRLQRNLSQLGLVQQLEETQHIKLSISALNAIENQKRELHDVELMALSKVLQIPVTWFLYGGSLNSIRIVLFDQAPQRRAQIQTILKDDPLLNLVGAYPNLHKVFEIVYELKPKIVLWDLSFGLEAIPHLIKHFGSKLKFIILAHEPHLHQILDAITFGACGFIGLNSGFLNLPKRIKMINQGDFQLDSYSTWLFSRYMSYRRILTPSQMLVLSGILQKKDRPTLQKELVMSKEALRQHIYRIAGLLKLGKIRGEGGIRRHFEDGFFIPLPPIANRSLH